MKKTIGKGVAGFSVIAGLSGAINNEAYAQSREAPKPECIIEQKPSAVKDMVANWRALTYCKNLVDYNRVPRNFPYQFQETRTETAQPQTDTMQQQGQTQESRANNVLSHCPEYSVSGDGILLKDYIFNSPGSPDELRKVFSCLYSPRGEISYDVIPIKEGLGNIRDALRKGTQTPERLASIRYVGRLLEILQTAPETDSASLDALKRAIEDTDLTEEERAGINPNTYLIMARSPAIRGHDAQSVAIIANIDAGAAGYVPVPRIPIPGAGVPTQPADTTKPGSEASRARQARDDSLRAGILRRNKENNQLPISLTLDAILGQDEMIGGAFGASFGPIGASASYVLGGDKITEEISVPLSKGRVGAGKEEETDLSAFGVNVELHPLGPVFVGAGYNFEKFTDKVNENIFSAAGDTLDSNTDSKAAERKSKSIFGGVQTNAFRAAVGYNTEHGLFVRAGIPLNLRKRQNR